MGFTQDLEGVDGFSAEDAGIFQVMDLQPICREAARETHPDTARDRRTLDAIELAHPVRSFQRLSAFRFPLGALEIGRVCFLSLGLAGSIDGLDGRASG